MPGFDLIDHGTQLHSNKVAAAIPKSKPGMAHFAELGSSNTCGKCRYFNFNKDRLTAKQVCRKYKAMMGKQDKTDRKLSPKQVACKFFEKREGA